MISCPNCNQTLPDSAVNCQFCGADVRSVKRQRQTRDNVTGATSTVGSGLSPDQVVQVWVLLGAVVILTIGWALYMGLSAVPSRYPGQLTGGWLAGPVVLVQVVRLIAAVLFVGRAKVPVAMIRAGLWVGVGWSVVSLIVNGIYVATNGPGAVGFALADVACLAVHYFAFGIINRSEEEGLLP